MGKDLERRGRSLFQCSVHTFAWKYWGKTINKNNSNHVSRCPDQDLKQVPPEYKSEALLSHLPWQNVWICISTLPYVFMIWCLMTDSQDIHFMVNKHNACWHFNGNSYGNVLLEVHMLSECLHTNTVNIHQTILHIYKGYTTCCTICY
jgi:hypothetical protein